MKKRIIFFVLLLIYLINFISATQIWTNEEVKVTSFREKIDLYKEIVSGDELSQVKITDIFSIKIPQNLRNETIFIATTPPFKDYSDKAESIHNISFLICGVGESSLEYNLDHFGLSCKDGEKYKRFIKEVGVNGLNLIEFNASLLNWSSFLLEEGSKGIYVSISYNIDNFVIKSENYNTLWIKRIECDYNSPNCFDKFNKIIYVNIPANLFVSGGDNYRLFNFDKESESMLFIQKDFDEDLILSYTDTEAENKEKYFNYILGILTSLIISLIFVLITPRLTSLAKSIKWLILLVSGFALGAIIIQLANILNLSPNIKLIILLTTLIPIGFWSLWDLLGNFRFFKIFKEWLKRKLFS